MDPEQEAAMVAAATAAAAARRRTRERWVLVNWLMELLRDNGHDASWAVEDLTYSNITALPHFLSRMSGFLADGDDLKDADKHFRRMFAVFPGGGSLSVAVA
jgi:hypothetical protein